MGIRTIDNINNKEYADCQLNVFKVETVDTRMTLTAKFPINSAIFTGRYLK